MQGPDREGRALRLVSLPIKAMLPTGPSVTYKTWLAQEGQSPPSQKEFLFMLK